MAFLQRLFKREEEPIDVSEDVDSSNVIPGRPSIVVASGGQGLTEYENALLSNIASQRRRLSLDTLNLIRDFNPDAGLAIWNFLRLVNPENSFKVYQVDGDKKVIDDEGQKALELRCDDQFGIYGSDYGGGVSVLIDVLTLSLVTQGAIAGELELSESLGDVLDWCPIDPNNIVFVRDSDTGHYLPTAYHLGKQYLLPKEQFRHIPLDPAVGEPYGRNLMWPTLETAFFQAEVLRDLKMVAHFAGHPRLSMQVTRAVFEQRIPRHLREPGREKEARAWMDGILTEIASQYRTLKPDDALVTFDDVKPDSLDAGRPSYNIDALIEVVEAQVFSSLKQLPVLMGRHKGQGLAHGDIAWQIYAYGIRSLRRPILSMMSWFGTQTLRIWGRKSVCIFSIPTLRSQDRLKEAQAEAIEQKIWFNKYLAGLVTQEEWSNATVGHAPVANPDVFALLNKPELGFGGPRPIEEMPSPGSEEESVTALLLKDALNLSPQSSESRQQNAQHVVGEAELFRVLPTWMKRRIDATQQSMDAYATVRRDAIFSELIEDGVE